MKGPVPEEVFRHMKVERTGDIATTRPNHCYECDSHVDTAPLMNWTFPDIDAKVSLWCCEECYYDKVSVEHTDWNDAEHNV